MASLLYNSALNDALRGSIDFDTDTFKMMLVTGTYAPDKDAHSKRNQVTNEAAGTGYTAGGSACACTVALNTGTDQVTLTFAQTSWAGATLTARGCVIYKSRGGASTADELVGYGDFGSDVTATGGTFTVNSGVFTFQN